MKNIKKKARILQGNEACVEGAILAGVRFFAGYPITPASEIAEGMARKLPQIGGKFIQMEDKHCSYYWCFPGRTEINDCQFRSWYMS